ncbi:alpha/beta fold hydrolase [Micromonospora terminaliae]|uniref:alpha/beta fold hydrolase n=1 Tax=Micromonospora terminaliae TaxID=1914461 RepID=UPI001FCC6437|nr:alpha/beta hydrolase [Micromonospora terminaliae]
MIEELGIRLITIDRPGVGRSDPEPGRMLLHWPPNVEAVADHLAISSFAVVGRSAGAAYAAACAFSLPHRVMSATLISGVGPPSTGAWKLLATSDFRKLIFWLRLVPPLARPTLWLGVRLIRPHVRRLLDRHIAGLPAADQQVLGDGAMHAMRVSSLQEAFCQAEVGIYHDALLLARDWGFDPAAISTPVRIWHGESDTIVNVEFGRRLATAIRHSRSSFTADAGHYLMFTHWRQILEAVVEDSRAEHVAANGRGTASPARRDEVELPRVPDLTSGP